MVILKHWLLCWLLMLPLLATEVQLQPANTLYPEGQSFLPGAKDLASGASSDSHKVWYLNGIGGNWLAVGSPNTLNRRDKVTVRFDLSSLIFAGAVKKAWLCYRQNPFGYRSETILVEHFTSERWELSGKDLISTQTEVLGRYISVVGSGQSCVILDVSSAVNADLERGFGACTFRIASETAEKLGNPENAPSGVSIVNGSIELRIETP